jgi:hypothetical protein
MAIKRVPRGTMGMVLDTAKMPDAWFAANHDTSRSIQGHMATTGHWRRASTIAAAREIGPRVCQPCKAIKWEIIGDNSTPEVGKEPRKTGRPLGLSSMARVYKPTK